jgi:hypothetical protein
MAKPGIATAKPECRPLSALRRRRQRSESSDHDKNGSSYSFPSSQSLSVTVLNQEQLPSYSSERSYLLSDIEETARETVFLDEFCASVQSNVSRSAISGFSALHPIYIIFYLQWQANVDVDEFVESVLLYSVRRLWQAVSEHPCKKKPASLDKLELHTPQRSPSLSADEKNDSSSSSTSTNGINVYVVVDRIDLPSSALASHAMFDLSEVKQVDDDYHDWLTLQQEDCARSLAKTVAAHAELRPLLQGITVAVCNGERASPGLEACAEVLHIGSEDRHKFYSGSIPTLSSTATATTKSYISLFVNSQDELLDWRVPLIDKVKTDHNSKAIFNISDVTSSVSPWQTRIVAEWNAQGNLQSFARRAHAEWRKSVGLFEQPLCIGPARKPVSRKPHVPPPVPSSTSNLHPSVLGNVDIHQGDIIIRSKSPGLPKARQGYNPHATRRKLIETVIDASVLAIIAVYVWFHFQRDIRKVACLDFLDEVVQFLREL